MLNVTSECTDISNVAKIMNRFQVLIACVMTVYLCQISRNDAKHQTSCSETCMMLKILKVKVEAMSVILKKIMANSSDGATKGVTATGRAIYIRWGHTACPSSASIIYSGYAGGSDYTETGGASDYICLPKNPLSAKDSYDYLSTGRVYGAEYQVFLKGRIKGRGHNYDVPCAVCQSMSHPNMFMYPARYICPKGWHEEYHGQLMSGRSNHKAASQFVCVDVSKMRIPNSQTNHNGKLFYPVKAVCGSLKCPPYKDNQLLSCTVCTQ